MERSGSEFMKYDSDNRSFSSKLLDAESESWNRANQRSPHSVTRAFSNTCAASNIDSDVMNSVQGCENRSFLSNLLDSDDTDSLGKETAAISGRNIDFESAGFSTGDALKIQRRLKMQKLLRTLNANLSE